LHKTSAVEVDQRRTNQTTKRDFSDLAQILSFAELLLNDLALPNEPKKLGTSTVDFIQ